MAAAVLASSVTAQAPPPTAATANPATSSPSASTTATNAPAASTNAAPSTNALINANKPPGADSDDQLSFQGANIDMVVQWLAKTTGKSVVKHPKVQCQLTIVSSKSLKQ